MAEFIPNTQQNTGLFIATTDVYDTVSRINEVDVSSKEFKLLLVRLYQNLNNIVLALNLKDSAYYITQEFMNSQSFFPDPPTVNPVYRQAYRLVVNVGALNAGITSTAHNLTITADWTFTRIYGTATDNGGGNYYPIPYVGAAAAYISLMADNTNVVIDNQSGVVFNKCLVILEYLKN